MGSTGYLAADAGDTPRGGDRPIAVGTAGELGRTRDHGEYTGPVSEREVVTPRPAASVVLLRPASGGPEILYLRRNPSLAFHGDYWVFPGGRIDAADRADTDDDEAAAARRAAVREAHEEAGLRVPAASLAFAVHWTTPETSPIRFATWFFVAPATAGAVQIDGTEILDHRWLRPADALERQRAREIKLAAPTFALTTRLAGFADVDGALAAVAGWPEERLLGRLIDVDDGVVALYHQDVAYADACLDREGPRHRLWMVRSGWRYERAF